MSGRHCPQCLPDSCPDRKDHQFFSGDLPTPRSVLSKPPSSFDRGNHRFGVSHASHYFQDFTPSREHATALAFVVIHGPHKLDFIARVIAFTCRRINQTAAFHFPPRRHLSLLNWMVTIDYPNAIIRLTAITAYSLILNSSFYRFSHIRSEGHTFHLFVAGSEGGDPSQKLGSRSVSSLL